MGKCIITVLCLNACPDTKTRLFMRGASSVCERCTEICTVTTNVYQSFDLKSTTGNMMSRFKVAFVILGENRTLPPWLHCFYRCNRPTVDLVIFACLNFREFIILRLFTKWIREFFFSSAINNNFREILNSRIFVLFSGEN